MKIKFLLVLVIILSIKTSFAQSKKTFISSLATPNTWVDSVFKKLSRHDHIAQLLMVRAHTNLGQAYQDSVGDIIKKNRLGGVVFFQGGPGRQVNLTNTYQQLVKVPLLIANDGEWGLGMRLDSTLSYPYQLTLGAIKDNNLIYDMGRQIARDYKRMGMHINFGPDMDVNNNPKNPVIGFRSFGDNKINVAKKGIAYMKGMQDMGLLVSAKHFPGHGDTDVDSHYDLPQLPFSLNRLDSLEMYPFKEAIKAEISGIMIAHMSIPALDTTKNVPSTLSKPVVTGQLKNRLGFKGLIFSDAMDMKGVTKYFKDGEADVRGLQAGMDILELSENSEIAIKAIRKAIREKRLTWDDINYKTKKVLAAKYWAGLNNYQPVNTNNLITDITSKEAQVLNQKLADAAITVLKGDSLFPLITDFVKRKAIVSIGSTATTVYQQELKKAFPQAMLFNISKDAKLPELNKLVRELAKYDEVIMGIHDLRSRPGSQLNFSSDVKLFIAYAAKFNNSITTVFANPYTIAGLPGIEANKALIMAYQKEDIMQKAAVKVLLGRINATGKLPVNINAFFKFGDGLTNNYNLSSK